MTLKPYDITRILSAQTQAQVFHWQVKSYALHVALGEFYDGLHGIADELVETDQMLGRVLVDPDLLPVANYDANLGTAPIIDFLGKVLSWLQDDLQKRIPQEETGIANLVADLINLTNRTLYKVTLA